ncbi:MAG TPA: Ig-like domain-containing protein [Solirubrobacteraceae bacterium]|nr:Ig-like domain-containing protein [Solirubrobacteraceae bacterium]
MAAVLALPAGADARDAVASAKPKCMGRTATIVGTSKAESGRRRIVGTKRADVIVAKGGGDAVLGRGGNDLICAGAGNDRVDGGAGNDRIQGDGGKDRLKGGKGNDRLSGGNGGDRLDGGPGTDSCDGGKGMNTIVNCEADVIGVELPPLGQHPPLAAADAATTTEDAPATIAVLANDSDPDGEPLTLTGLQPGAIKGGVSIVGGQVSYDPRGRLDQLGAGQTASEAFGYTIADAGGAVAAGTVTVTVTGVDDPPLARDDAAVAAGGPAATAIDVLANDTDVDGGRKAVVSVDDFTSQGSVTITGGGTGVTYTPDPGFCGTDTFTYTLNGGSTATVTVTVGCADDPPTAVDDTVTVAENAGASAIDVLANDTDADGGPKAIVSVTQPANGTVAITSAGSGLTYAPDPAFCGTDTFTYTLNGGSTATVTVTVACAGQPPVAVNDSATIAEDAPATTLNVRANDTDIDGGPMTVVSVTQPAYGSVEITTGGAAVTYTPAPDHCGSVTFTYTLNGGSTATVTVTITCVDDPPVAVADSATVLEDATATAVPVLANDTDVDGGPKTIAGVTQPANGTVAITGGGSGLTYRPNANYCNSGGAADTFTYSLNGGSTGTVSMTVTCVNDAPAAVNDSFSGALANTRFVVGTTAPAPQVRQATGSVLANDTDVDTPHGELRAVAAALTTANGGTVTLEDDGQLVYDPPAGFTGTDSVAYTVSDRHPTDPRTASATLSIVVAGPMPWYVDDSAAAGGDGTSAKPLQTLAPLTTAGALDGKDGANDRIFVYAGTYTGGIVLESGQRLLGEPEGLVVTHSTTGTTHNLVAAGGTRPAVSAPSGNVVTLSSGNHLQDLALGAGGTSLAGTSIGDAIVADTTIANPSGKAIDIDGSGAATSMSLSSVSSTNSPTDAIRLANARGTVAIGGGALSNAGGTDVAISGGDVAFSYAGTITDDLGSLVSITGTSGGAKTFSGAITDGNDGDGSGISIVNNTAGSVSFTGGVVLSTGANNAFTAQSGAAGVSVTGAANTLATTTGTALRVDGSALAPAGLTFRRIDSNGGSSPGILLSSTTGTGGLTVTGDGATAGSGGTIANKGGTDNTTTGTGVWLNGTRNVSLSRMQLNGFSNYAIRGSSVNAFTLANSTISGASGDNPNIDEAAVAFSELTGAAAITASNISGGVEDNLQVRNYNAASTLNRLTISGTTIGANDLNNGNDGVSLEAGAGTFNVSVQNSAFTSARGDLFQHNAINSAQSDLLFTGNTLSNNHGNIVGGGGGVTIAASGSAAMTYTIDNNSFRDARGSALFVGKAFGGSPGNGTARGTIRNNTVGVAGVANSGSREGSGLDISQLARGGHTTLVSGNIIRGYNNHGILLTAGGAASSVTGLVHDGALNATLQSNTIAQPGSLGTLAMNGIHLNSGTNTGDQYNVCLGLSGNTVAGSGAAGGTDYRLRHRFDTKISLPGYTGSRTDAQGDVAGALTSYLTPRTNGAFTLSHSSNTASATGGFLNTPGGAACPQP